MILPEQRLAEAKIMVMFQDMCGVIMGESPTEKPRIQWTAYNWVFDSGSDFKHWCDLAGLNVDYMRLRARKILMQGFPLHRAQAGGSKDYLKKKAYRERKKAA